MTVKAQYRLRLPARRLLDEKVDPYLRPLYDALYDMLEPEAFARLMERGTIEVAPLAYMRGRTLNDSFIILDEAQNTTPEQMKMFLTRLGFGSKVVVTGDVTQIDLPERARSLRACSRSRDDPRRHRRPRVRRARLRATSCATGSSRTSSTPTSVRRAPPRSRRAGARATTRATASDVFGADEQSTSRSTLPRWLRLARLVLDGRAASRRRRDVADLRRRGRRSPSSTSGSWASRARPTCSRSRSTTTADGASPIGGRPGSSTTATAGVLGDVVVCPAVAGRQARSTAAAPTTSSRCSSCTACCTCSTTTTPRRATRAPMRRTRAQERSAARRADDRPMSGADWAIARDRHRAVRARRSRSSRCRDRVHAHEPHPRATRSPTRAASGATSLREDARELPSRR